MRNLIIILNLVVFLFLGCSQKSDSFSLLADANVYKQEALRFQQKIDILWVMDNSVSMRTSQEAVAANFRSFIERFENLEYDFHMAVTTTDTYRALLLNQTDKLRFSDGIDPYSGYPIMTIQTPLLENVFITNILQGTNGHGDERAFQSFRAALESPLNSDFLREDAFLAVIIVSDEDDFSHNSLDYSNRDYNYPGLHSVDSYIDFLETIKPSEGDERNFSVSAISIFDPTCLTQLNDEWSGRIIGSRYRDIVEATEGVLGSLCSNFGETLDFISSSLVSLTTQFVLNREPIIETIKVYIDGQLVPQNSEHGWSYNASKNSIQFHGHFVPQDGALVKIIFDPVTIK